MKNKCVKVLVIGLIVIGSISGISALNVYDYCICEIGDISAETSGVGVSTKGAYYFETYKTSQAGANCGVYAAWTGYPYTLESSRLVEIGKTWSGTEVQSRNSNFFVKVFSMYFNKTYAYASIRAL